MKKQPRIQVELTQGDRILEIIGRGLLIIFWIIVLTAYPQLPETIPIHFDISGEADGFGGKVTVFILPLLATIMYIGMTILNKYPCIFNYPVKITEENAQRQYTYATRLITVIKTLILLLFIFIVLEVIFFERFQSGLFSRWFLPLTMGLMFLPLMYYIIKATKAK